MSKLRAPWVATMSVAALTPCCDRDEPPQKDTSVTTAPAGMATAIATSTTAPHGFEEVPDILNPKVSGKVVVLADTHCYTYGPMAHSSGIFYERDRLPCPKGIEATLDQCRGGILQRHDEGCRCFYPEGNPPPPPNGVTCPE